jgi:phage major head subunit gpT-like protein
LLGVSPTHIVIPKRLEMTARAILKAALIANGGTNVFNGFLDMIVVPDLPGSGLASTWYMVDLSAPIKPLLLQIRKPVTLVAKANIDDDNVFWNSQFYWGLDARGIVGYGPWWLAARANGD